MLFKLKSLRDQVIVVTGGSSGNGLAIARAAAEQGASLVLAARNAAALETVRDELVAIGARVAICIADVANEADVERVGATAVNEFGGFDSWINNAAAATYGTIEQVSVADHRRTFDVNYFGYLYGCRVAARQLRARGGGAIINVGSILGDRAIVEQGPYCATKHAIQALTDVMRMELERDSAGISVTLIKPAAINTPYAEHARNYMSVPPRLPAPLYDPALVAEAALFACVTPRRQIYVGGAGLVSSVVGQVAPRLTDLVMEAVGRRMQQKPDDAGDPDRRDNLYAAKQDGAVHGSQRVATRRTSLLLKLQQLPRAASLAGGAGVAALALGAVLSASRRRRR